MERRHRKLPTVLDQAGRNAGTQAAARDRAHGMVLGLEDVLLEAHATAVDWLAPRPTLRRQHDSYDRFVRAYLAAYQA